MENGKIVDVKKIANDRYVITYDVLNNKKDILYKNDSKRLLSKLKDYINSLNKRNAYLEDKAFNKSFRKRILICTLAFIFTSLIVYMIMSFALNESLSIGSIGYLSCLIIIFLAFVSSMLVDSYIDKSVENEILRNENEILRVESLLDELKMQDKTKTKSSQKEKL